MRISKKKNDVDFTKFRNLPLSIAVASYFLDVKMGYGHISSDMTECASAPSMGNWMV